MRGIHRWSVDSPHKGLAMRGFGYFGLADYQTTAWPVILDILTLFRCHCDELLWVDPGCPMRSTAIYDGTSLESYRFLLQSCVPQGNHSAPIRHRSVACLESSQRCPIWTDNHSLSGENVKEYVKATRIKLKENPVNREKYLHSS